MRDERWCIRVALRRARVADRSILSRGECLLATSEDALTLVERILAGRQFFSALVEANPVLGKLPATGRDPGPRRLPGSTVDDAHCSGETDEDQQSDERDGHEHENHLSRADPTAIFPPPSPYSPGGC